MAQITRSAVVLGALVGALVLGAGTAAAGVAPAGFAADPNPGPSSKCIEIRGATGCYRAYGDVFTAFDTERDGHHVFVFGAYGRLTPRCDDFGGNGTSKSCAYPDIPEHSTVCLGVVVAEGSTVVRDNTKDGFQSDECFPTT